MKLKFFLLAFFIQLALFSQEVSTKLVEKTPFPLERFVGVDKFNNFYGIKKNTFYKIEGSKTYQFADIQLGELTSVDLLNPLKITLFYRDMNTVVIVDNRLNEINRINFTTITNFRNIDHATTGKDNSLWIFNIDLQRLELFDYNTKKVLFHTQPINHEIIQQESNFNFCWLLQEKKLEFYNSYGSFMSAFPTTKNFQFTQDNNLIVGRDQENWMVLKRDAKAFTPLEISQNAVKDFYLNNENLYLYTDNFIYRYQLNLSN